VHPAAETEVGEELHEVDAADGRPVDEVLALPAAMEPARHRQVGVVEGPLPVAVVEEELDLAESGGLAPVRAGEENVVGLLGA
jgi:hypothetical protein